ncbi:hypothetical protein L0128_09555 [candidate division KSB1 bacterium]|nr:hypothetical protein [candidate division KSB1 bacterium]
MMFKRPSFVFWTISLLLCTSTLLARDSQPRPKKLGKTTLANVQFKTHNVGNMWLTVTNEGLIGAYGGIGGYPNCEFPANSDVEYLFTGSIWIGALVGKDTLVSVGADGWAGGQEMRPGWTEADTILYHSTRIPGDTLAMSEQDFICSYMDTSLLFADLDAEHEPMGLEIEQRSYAWSYSYAEDFVIYDFYIKNRSALLGTPRIFKSLFMGVYIDGDCGHTSIANYAQDDITGFLRVNSTGDTVNLAWIKDNDGDGGLTPGVTGVRVLFPDPKTVSYNWWDPPSKWGPTNPNNPNDWAPHPGTDAQKYRVMSNGEIDPDQMAANAPSGIVTTGMDTRYFLSFGPFDLEPDSVLKLTLAYVGGLPGPGYDEFEDIGRNARWARDVYDNPPADGIPDFKGPPPPPSPKMKVVPGDRQVTLFWDEAPEYALDTFTKFVDFQGYRIYRSRSGIISEMELLGEFDKLDGYGLNIGFDAIEVVSPEVEIAPNGDTTIWKYTYTDRGLTNGEFLYYAVTSFDSGYVPTGLDPLESSPAINLTRIAPSAGPQSDAEMTEVLVVPNPYRLTADYYGMGWETGSGDTDRRIDFIQIPVKCKIRIYSLAGDLVALIDHEFPAKSATKHSESWDLVSRNIQMIASGIYLFSVETESGKKYVGKFVVIY